MLRLKALILSAIILVVLSTSSYSAPPVPEDSTSFKVGFGLNLVVTRMFFKQDELMPFYPLLEFHLIPHRNFQMSFGAWYSMSTTDNSATKTTQKDQTFIFSAALKYLAFADSKVSILAGISYDYGIFPKPTNVQINFTPAGYSIGPILGVNFRIGKYVEMFLNGKFGYSTTTYYSSSSSYSNPEKTDEAFSIIGLNYGLFYKF